MWVRKRLDIGWSELAAGILGCARPAPRTLWERRVEQARGCDTLICLSVRSGLDLLLASRQWPAGSEVLVSALTIPDMPRIITEHGLVPVPVDLDLDTLGPHPPALRRAITPASRALLVAHLMGGRVDMAPVLQIAREHGLLVIEDCAQAFDGSGYCGHPAADISMFSFGTIKTATALGGACLQIRDQQLRDEMRARQARYPRQPQAAYLRRLLKAAAMKSLSSRFAYARLVDLAGRLGRDYDLAVNRASRGFSGKDFFAQIRRQPATPLLQLLDRRLRTYDAARITRRAGLGRLLASRLAGVWTCPGAAMQPHSFWVFPVLADDPAAMIARLRAAGFDATQGQSMGVVPPPPGRESLAARTTEQILARTVYLPLYPELPKAAVLNMADVLLDQAALRPKMGSSHQMA